MNTHCFVPGCKTGYPSQRKANKLEGKRNLSLFSTPKDEVFFEKWKRIIPRADMELTRKHCICELHFQTDDIERYYVTKLTDGSVSKIERGKPLLKPGVLLVFNTFIRTERATLELQSVFDSAFSVSFASSIVIVNP